jgi:2-polyprenyl-6-methoxyphenol hydroxylase-like FAD-dependent oxidoreductase
VPAVNNALVVGGGPAGLAAAIALRNAGVEVDLAEIAMDRTIMGSELLISSPNLRVLDSLGLAENVVVAGVPINSCEFYNPDGTLQASVPTPNVARDGLPAGVGISRQAFYGTLYDGAVARGTHVLHDTSITGIENTTAAVVVTLTNGDTRTYELVVGADGYASRVRQLRFPDADKPAYSGQCVWRARVPRFPEGDPSLSIFFGQKTNAGLITVDASTSYLFCLVNEPEPIRIDAHDYPSMLKELLEEFDGAAGWSRDHLGGPDTIHFSPMWAHIMPGPWHDDRVVLVGDAAHSTTPHIGYGAGLATEDGIVLGEEVASAASLDAAFARFMARRFDRCRAVVEGGLQISRWQQGIDTPTSPTAQPELTHLIWGSLAKNP